MFQTTNLKSSNKYDLEERCFKFAQEVGQYVNKLPKKITNIEYGRQVIRSSGSTGSNYIEANESMSKRDFIMRIKISKKEAKETIYWLRLTQPDQNYENEKSKLIQEATELMKILGSILEKSK